MHITNVPATVGETTYQPGQVLPEPIDGRDYTSEVRAGRITHIPDALVQGIAATVAAQLTRQLQPLRESLDDIRAQLSGMRRPEPAATPVRPGVDPKAIVIEKDGEAEPGATPPATEPPPPAAPEKRGPGRPRADAKAAPAQTPPKVT